MRAKCVAWVRAGAPPPPPPPPPPSAGCGSSGAEGRERYSTEVVLRPFRSALTLLGSGPRDDAAETEGEAQDYGAASGKTESRRPSLDDDIPF
jgi:hypothetical protein